MKVFADPVELLAKLVAAPSPNPPGDERAVAEVIRREALALGLPEPELHALAPERPNLILRLGEGAPRLILAAHMDTMPPGDLRRWRSDPFRLERENGRLVGLGSADMKAAIAAMLVAAARVARNPELAGSLTLIFVADEENCSYYGMEWLAREQLLEADAAVVVEPSSFGERSWERLFVGQRGSCLVWLTARGEPGHSGMLVPRERRASAAFARALSALIEAELFAGCAHPVDGTPPTVNVATMVEGGMVPFAHPEALRASIDIRTIEGMTQELILAELRRVIGEAGLADRVSLDPAPHPQGWFPPGETVRDERLLRAARGAWREVLGVEPVEAIMTAGTDSAYLNVAGIPALPAFGPGSLAVAHKPNEALEADDVRKGVDLLEALVRRYRRGEG